jgi:hypothetical protein
LLTSTGSAGEDDAVRHVDYDALGHDRLSQAIAAHLDILPVGAVVAVQGSWGSGKTDVVDRVFAHVERNAQAGPKPLWVNPWKYGRPDLITPLVLEILDRIPPSGRHGSVVLRDAARTLLRAGNAMLFKAVSVVAPFGEIVGAGETAVDEFLTGLFDGSAATVAADLDPLASMADRFRDLVAEYIRLVEEDGRLLICVDDLDRCLPDHQIAMLEAIHFLTSAGASCSFLIALDPVLARQAAATHYRTDGFDSSRYMDKLFDLRIQLPALAGERIGPFVRGHISRPGRFPDERETLASLLKRVVAVDADRVVEECSVLFSLPELANPRLISRVLLRVALLAQALEEAQDSELAGGTWLRPLLIWSAITERWPQVRELLQAIDLASWRSNTELMAYYYGITNSSALQSRDDQLSGALTRNANVTARLPASDRAPDLGQFLHDYLIGGDEQIFAALGKCDTVMGRYGM